MSAARVRRVLAIDPGSAKCGLAVVERGGAIIARAIIPTKQLPETVAAWLARHAPDDVVIGRGTNSAFVRRDLLTCGIEATAVDETGTTLAARARYFSANPPRGWRRLLPRGLLLPPEPIDDWAAVLIGERRLLDGF